MVSSRIMPQPIELCLEDVAADEAAGVTRYLRCVALGGHQPGLGIDPDGNVTWRTAAALAAEIWVSGDEQLILLRPAGAPTVRLSRASRELELPEGKPVVVLGGDRIEVGPRRLQLHVHGVAESVYAPTPLLDRALGHAARAAALLAVSAAVAGCATPAPQPVPPVEVREQPPSPPEYLPPPGTGSALVPSEAVPPPPSASAPIEVRDTPPKR